MNLFFKYSCEICHGVCLFYHACGDPLLDEISRLP